MNREIETKFRGRDVITGNWFFGYYYPSKGHCIVRDENDAECIVLKKTVGEFIGMRDVNNKEIYEGDILQWTSKFRDTDITTPNKRGHVKYNQQGCVWHINYEMCGKHYYKDLMATFGGEVYVMETVEIVGNIFETPELLNF